MKLTLSYPWGDFETGDVVEVEDPITAQTLIAEGHAVPSEKGARVTARKEATRGQAAATGDTPAT